MKKIFLLALFLVLFAANSVFAQSNHLEFQIATPDKAFTELPDNTIQITIKGDYPGYTIMIFDKEPWLGATPIRTIKESKTNTVNIENLQPGVYHVCVLDAKENMNCKKVELIGR